MEVKNYTVEEVTKLFNDTVIATFAGTDDGQKHLNRIAKAITNESLEKRIQSQRETLAAVAFNKELAKVATKTPDKVSDLVSRKAAWIADYIVRKYGEGNE